MGLVQLGSNTKWSRLGRHLAEAKWAILALVSFAISVTGFITHVIVGLTTKAYLLLIVGVLAPPIGVIHGIGCWFGLF